MCDGSGSGMSTSARADSGPVRSTIWTARMARERISARRTRARPHRVLAVRRAPELHHGVGAPRAPALRVYIPAEARESMPNADVGRKEDVRVAECAHRDVRRGPIAH